MNITPKDILEKEFGKKFNGYDQEQVDEFLDEIIKQFESLLEENENVIA
ncbi:DivIVA domain-containing protein, partial [Christensenella hongkongensis]